jgi:hypothetical protein
MKRGIDDERRKNKMGALERWNEKGDKKWEK